MQFGLSRFTSFGATAFSRPVFIFSFIILTISVILSSLILAGGSSDLPTLRKFYLVSFKYDPSSSFYKDAEKLDANANVVADGASAASGNNSTTAKTNGSKLPSFHEIRVSYQGVCVDTSEGWDCAKKASKLPDQDLSNDPLNLVDIADLYKERIVWSFPFWVTCLATGVAYFMVMVNAIPIPFTIPLWTKKVAAGALGIASISTLGGMILGSVTSGSVATLVHTITLEAIVVHNGSMVLAAGWTVFTFVTIAFLSISAIVMVEWSVAKVDHVVESKMEEATGGMSGRLNNLPISKPFVGLGLSLRDHPSNV